jgi:ribonuclease HI
MDVELYFDGACEPVNPGGTGSYGWVFKDAATGQTIDSGDGDIGSGRGVTNNVAEYYALGLALKRLAEQPPHGLTRVSIFGDSKLVVCQMNDEWRCNAPHLAELRDRCRGWAAKLQTHGIAVSYRWVPREHNEEADALSQQAWTRATGRPFPERIRRK